MPARNVTSVLQDIVQTLSTAEGPLSTREIAQRKNLNWKTTEKYLEVLSGIGTLGSVTRVKVGPRIKLWTLEKRGLLSRPAQAQLEVVREHFPQPEEEDMLLVQLLVKGAITRERTAQPIRPSQMKVAKSLAERGHLILTGSKAYLTETGATIAQGLLKIYPELVKQPL